jgi:hypothetical protein
MTHGAQDNALAEIALALSMAFFSILVLALVSMGGSQGETAQTVAKVAIDQGAALSQSQAHSQAQGESKTVEADAQNLLIFFKGDYFDSALKKINPEAFAQKETVIVAVDPALSMTEALAAEKQVPAKRKTVTTLDARWIAALKEKTK